MSQPGEFSVGLVDDGTLDTVIEIEHAPCGTVWEWRYDLETAADYRDETGFLDLPRFLEEIVEPDLESDGCAVCDHNEGNKA
jgi:hypothetical protein